MVLATGAKIYGQGMRTLRLSPTTGAEVLLEDALCVPGLTTNLFSVRAATMRGGLVEIVGDCCEVSAAPSHVVMRARPNDQNLYALELTVAATAAVAYGQTSCEAARLWHRRYSDLSAVNLRLVSTLVRGIAALRSAEVAPTEGAICQPLLWSACTPRRFIPRWSPQTPSSWFIRTLLELSPRPLAKCATLSHS